MIPPKTDPVWREIVDRTEDYEVSALPTKMLFMRIKLLRYSGTSQSMTDAVNAAFDFFSKNEEAVRDDIEIVFGRQNGQK